MMTTCAPNRVFAARVAVVQHQRKSVVVYSNGAINPDIKKDEAKVVDTVVASAHVKHNEACGDNVGPLLVKKE
ncbi:putative CDGSH iron-sulfur domain-containing protein NEET [Nannochloris sp. 'desiccata']|nr:hypothetical protein KSW81_004956 [Chlorella desiccata (nom. nud.)]KAH7618060.1 putative CDGSH iron-sulfur domain-containing protein NEET [Chlorella desiccata (nom. nud.)]